MTEQEKIRQEAEEKYPISIERDFHPLSEGSVDINESARNAYISGASTRIELADEVKRLREALEDAKLQIEYLHEKFEKTGTGMAVLARIKTALNKQI